MRQIQRALSLIFPDQCILCEARVDGQGGLCGACWHQTPFLHGLVCDLCGVPLPGEEDARVFCDECLAVPRPWQTGRAALAYQGAGRRVVLALKHGDRLDLAPAAAGWMLRAGRPVFSEQCVLVPVPIHWSRLVTRRYNQAAELARAMGAQAGLDVAPDALIRTARTPRQDGKSFEDRFRNVTAAIAPHPKHGDRLDGRDVVLIDDVMTSGATLAATTEAALAAGACQVSVLVLARAMKGA